MANHAARRAFDASRVTSGMSGNGGRPTANNGHADIAPDRSSTHARISRSGYKGSQRHKSHFKYSQDKYESHM